MPSKVTKKERHAQQDAWNATHTKRYAMRLNLRTDADIIAHLESQPNTQGYIKSLIRADIERSQQDNK